MLSVRQTINAVKKRKRGSRGAVYVVGGIPRTSPPYAALAFSYIRPGCGVLFRKLDFRVAVGSELQVFIWGYYKNGR